MPEATPVRPENRAPCPARRAGNFPQNLIKHHHRRLPPPPARRISTIFNSAARISHLAHPKLRTAPRKSAAPRGPGKATARYLELFKNKASCAHLNHRWIGRGNGHLSFSAASISTRPQTGRIASRGLLRRRRILGNRHSRKMDHNDPSALSFSSRILGMAEAHPSPRRCLYPLSRVFLPRSLASNCKSAPSISRSVHACPQRELRECLHIRIQDSLVHKPSHRLSPRALNGLPTCAIHALDYRAFFPARRDAPRRAVLFVRLVQPRETMQSSSEPPPLRPECELRPLPMSQV